MLNNVFRLKLFTLEVHFKEYKLLNRFNIQSSSLISSGN